MGPAPALPPTQEGGTRGRTSSSQPCPAALRPSAESRAPAGVRGRGMRSEGPSSVQQKKQTVVVLEHFKGAQSEVACESLWRSDTGLA